MNGQQKLAELVQLLDGQARDLTEALSRTPVSRMRTDLEDLLVEVREERAEVVALLLPTKAAFFGTPAFCLGLFPAMTLLLPAVVR